MRIVILGCSRVGASLALMLQAGGHEVSVVDEESESFRRLGGNFRGRTVAGPDLDQEILRRAGVEVADACVTATRRDNSNIMTAQIARFLFSVRTVLAFVRDPLRAEVSRRLGIETLCTTSLGTEILADRLQEKKPRDTAGHWEFSPEAQQTYAPDLPMPEELAQRRSAAEGTGPSYTIIAGGGKVGYQLARSLVWRGDEVLILEKRPRRFQMLHDELGGVAHFGDACEVRTLAKAGMERANLVVSATGRDDDNFIICQVARRWFGVPRTIARINNPQNEAVFHRLGISETVSATKLLFQMIERDMVTSELVPLSLLRQGNLELVTVDVPRKSLAVNIPVKDLAFPKGCLLAAVIRGDDCRVVTGDTVFQPDDTVVALADPEKISAVREILLGRA